MTTLVRIQHLLPMPASGGDFAGQWTGGGPQEERSLIERARSCPESFGMLYRRHYEPIAAAIYRRIGDHATAEDLASDTFIAAWKGLGAFRAGSVPIRFWFLRIATNRVNSHVAKSVRRSRLLRLWPGAPLEATDPEHQSDALAALLSLPVDDQALLSLHHVEELTIEQVALVLGVPGGTVKSRLARARARLRTAIASQEDRS